MLVDIPTIRSLVETDLTDTAVQLLADDAEAEIVTRFGAHAEDGDVTERFDARGGRALFLSRMATSITSVSSLAWDGTTTQVSVSTFTFDGRHTIQTLGYVWATAMIVTYTPKSDTARRKRVLIDLVRLAVQYDATNMTRFGDAQISHVAYQQERDQILGGLSRMISSFA